jgi:hypothetical protein
MSAIGPQAADDAEPDVGPTEDERLDVIARAIAHGSKLALAATAVWYVLWLGLWRDLSAWLGLGVFVLAWVVGCWIARTLLQRQVDEEMRRRRALVKFARKLKTQSNSTL